MKGLRSGAVAPLLLLWGCSTYATFGGGSPPRVADALGMNSSIEWWGPGPGPDARLLRAFEAQELGGVGGLLRIPFFRGRIETAPGVYDPSESDGTVATLASQGVGVLGILMGGVPWDGNPSTDLSGTGFYPPAGPDGFARFAGFLASHYRGRVSAWEIWNEPNTGFFWPPKPDPAAYARLAAAVATAVREADPAAMVLLGAPAPARSLAGLFVEDDLFLDQVLREDPDLVHLVRGAAVHLYGNYPPIDPPESSGGGAGWDASYPGRLAKMKGVLASDGGGRLPLWVTEFGFCVTSTPEATLSEAEQGSYLVRASLLALAGGASRVFPWVLLDHGPGYRTFLGLPLFECERTFGLFRGTDPSKNPPAVPRPAWGMWGLMASTLGGAHFESDVSGALGGPADLHALRFREEGGGLGPDLVLWRASVGASAVGVSIPPAAWGGKVASVLQIPGDGGAESTLPIDPASALTVSVGTIPLYLLGLTN